MIALLLIAAVVLLVPAPAAMATHVQCGDVVTQDTTLDSDVVCEGESYGVTAITIAADNVTLDLGGHAVSAANSYEDETSNGIGTDGARSGLTVRAGTVVGFSTGVSLSASGSTVEEMTLENGSGGLSLGGDGNAVRRNQVFNTGEYGVSLRGDRVLLDRNVVRGSLGCALIRGEDPLVTHNLLADCYWAGGVDLYTRATVTRNTVTGNASGFGVSGEGATVRRNDFSGNETSGLSVSDPRAIVDRNIANDNSLDIQESVQGGIEIHVPGVVVSRNRADRNADYGIYAVPGTIDGGGNRASGNGNSAQCLNVSCSR